MPFIVWGSKIEVGIPSVDEQRHRLVDITNELYDAVQGHYAEDVIVGIFVELAEYTHVHFRAEEELLKKYHLDRESYTYHVAEHNAFTSKVNGYLEDYMKGGASISTEVLIYLRDWLMEHISATDLEDFGEIAPKIKSNKRSLI